MKENGFKQAKERSRRYPAQTITEAFYADDIALLSNTPAQVEALLHCLERAAAGIGLYVNVDKTKYMCFNQRCNISILRSGPLKLMDRFIYLKSNVSPTEKYISTRLATGFTGIDWLSVIWQSDLTDKIKQFFQVAVWSNLLHGCTTWTLTKLLEKKLNAIRQGCCELSWTSSGGNTLQNSNCMPTYHLSRKLSESDEPDMPNTAWEVRSNSKAIYPCGVIHMDKQRQDDQLEPVYNNAVPIQVF